MRSESPHSDLPPGMGGGEGFRPQAYQAQPGAQGQHQQAAYGHPQQRSSHPAPGSYGDTARPASTVKPFKVGGGSKVHAIIGIVVGLLVAGLGGGFSFLTNGVFGEGKEYVIFPWVIVIGLAILVAGVSMLFKKN
jgi:hypothetical protein